MSRTIQYRIAALAAVTLTLAGCGGTRAGTDPGTDSRGSDAVTSPVSPSPSPSTGASGETCTARSALDAADTGRRFCLSTGGVIRISLDGTADRAWTPVTADGPGLKAVNSGIVLRGGDASAAFEAVSAGTVRLSSSRPLCATSTGRISCKGLQEWWVTVVVTKR
ncbi:hypothetical protein ACIO93_25035 [Streptomyces sp. NPDC087903]|uniref:hypothetical protein n=1 Tax=Streptomyces sp. NPDC087903 TaxID=3365819 RepID=UPI0037F230A1